MSGEWVTFEEPEPDPPIELEVHSFESGDVTPEQPEPAGEDEQGE
jgi:hypothetical protein